MIQLKNDQGRSVSENVAVMANSFERKERILDEDIIFLIE